MMKITTNKGQEMEVRSAMPMKLRGKARLMVILEPGADMADAAATLEGLEWLRAQGETEGVSTTYEGYSRIASMIREEEDDPLQVTLMRKEVRYENRV